jgi:hypothetical protein
MNREDAKTTKKNFALFASSRLKMKIEPRECEDHQKQNFALFVSSRLIWDLTHDLKSPSPQI